MIGFILGIITLAVVALHALAVWAGYKIVTQFNKLRKSDIIGLGLIVASGLLHIINFIH